MRRMLSRMLICGVLAGCGLLSLMPDSTADDPVAGSPDITSPRNELPSEQDTRPNANPAARAADAPGDKHARPSVTPEQREQALAFAREHHPELARLLEQLEKSGSGEFARAVRELNAQIQRLERTRERTPARYPAQLESWKADSQIRVLMARWVRNHDDDLERQIRTLLRQRRAARQAQLTAERQRLEVQLKRIDQELNELAGDEDALIEREWRQLASRNDPQKKRPGGDPSSRTKQTPEAADGERPVASDPDRNPPKSFTREKN